ncbi:neural cell adhesion molecule L1.2 isoform X2 [Denticeps clupeoides]|uniref:Neural cell adhesion molecule L1 n=1 Tax=Denticeps clupeoides TaxID=299321 RepID=A0AAY4EPJ4_9TELE|nr:neural cell adhesion molecule L1-like isoform X2 [Denticeps clupeoides]
MGTKPRQQVGSRGRSPPPLTPLFALLLVLPITPGQAAIHIPSNYHIKDFKEPPVITSQPEPITAFASDDITLTCEASGKPTPTFRWVKDGKELDPSNNPDLSVSPGSGTFKVISEDNPINHYSGNYTCYASNELGTSVSNQVHVRTESPPTQQKEKKVKIKAEEGESVILQCNPPESIDPPNIHWMDKRLRHIELSERVTQGRDGNLYFSHVVTADSRNDYTCNAQYLKARTILSKEAITLTVSPSNSVARSRRPQMMRPSGSHSSYHVLRGQSLALECIVQGLPTPTIQWARKDGELTASRTSTENHNRLLSFGEVSESDAGQYQCTANNPQGTVIHTYSVTVEAAPYWTREPESELYAPGETVELDCKADGIPRPQLTWSINGVPLSEIDKDSRLSLEAGTLVLKDVKFGDTAVYQCKAQNKHGSILINTYVYVIELPPQILTVDGKTYGVMEGQKAELECKSFGSPRPEVSWESEDSGSALLLSSPRVTLATGGSLQISNVSHGDGGLYTCYLPESNVSISAELKVLNQTVIVSAPLDLRVQRGTAVVFTCIAKVDPELDHQLLWRRSGQKLIHSANDKKYTFEDPDLTVADVQDVDEGVYTCQIITRLDMAEASGSITIVDRPDPPSQLQIFNPMDRSVTLSWTPGDDHNSPVLEFVVEFEETEVETDGWEEIMRVSGDTHRTQVSLKPFLSYRFRVIAINDVGKSDPSAPSNPHSTPAAVPDHNPLGVRSVSVDPDTLVITWEEIDRRNFNGPNFQYKVLWRQVVGSGPSWQYNFTTAPPYEVPDVGTFTAFDIKVQAVNELGSAPDPEPTIGYSGEDAPKDAPMVVGANVLNSTAIEVTWAAIDKTTVRGHLLGYKIYLHYHGLVVKHHKEHRRKVGKGRRHVEERMVVQTGPNEEKKVVGGLRPYSHYGVSVTVYNAKGEGPPSDPLPIQTPEGVPSPPVFLDLKSHSEREMMLHWGPPTHPNGVLIGYQLRYQQTTDSENNLMREENIDDPTITHRTLTNLDPHSQYRFTLAGRTGVGVGMPIIKEGFTMLDGVPAKNISLLAGETSVNLTWVSQYRHMNVDFHIQYRNKNGHGSWKQTDKLNLAQSFYQLHDLEPGSVYKLDFIFSNKSFWKTEVRTHGTGMEAVSANFATEGWFIALVSAVVLLLLILLILCFIKRSKGGKYSVKDKEEGQVDSEARPMKDDTFGEYRSLESDNDEKRTASQPSLCDDSKLCSEDTHLGDYGNSHSAKTEVFMDESLASQYSAVKDGAEVQERSPLNPASATPTNHGLPSSVAILD